MSPLPLVIYQDAEQAAGDGFGVRANVAGGPNVGRATIAAAAIAHQFQRGRVSLINCD